MSGNENTSFYVRNYISLRRCIFLPGLGYFYISYQDIKTASNVTKHGKLSLALKKFCFASQQHLASRRNSSFAGLLHKVIHPELSRLNLIFPESVLFIS